MERSPPVRFAGLVRAQECAGAPQGGGAGRAARCVGGREGRVASADATPPVTALTGGGGEQVWHQLLLMGSCFTGCQPARFDV